MRYAIAILVCVIIFIGYSIVIGGMGIGGIIPLILLWALWYGAWRLIVGKKESKAKETDDIMTIRKRTSILIEQDTQQEDMIKILKEEFPGFHNDYYQDIITEISDTNTK